MNSGKSPSQDDEDLIRRFIAGDRQAFDDLYKRYAPEVMSFLAARVRSQENAEDLCQTAWSRVWENRESFDRRHFRGWLFEIARNAMIDAGRKTTRRGTISSIDVDGPEPAYEADPSERMSRNEELNALKDCIESVGGVFVEAVRRNKVDGESAEDIANDLGVDVGTIYSRIHKGKKKLLDCLEKKLK